MSALTCATFYCVLLHVLFYCNHVTYLNVCFSCSYVHVISTDKVNGVILVCLLITDSLSGLRISML